MAFWGFLEYSRGIIHSSLWLSWNSNVSQHCGVSGTSVQLLSCNICSLLGMSGLRVLIAIPLSHVSRSKPPYLPPQFSETMVPPALCTILRKVAPDRKPVNLWPALVVSLLYFFHLTEKMMAWYLRLELVAHSYQWEASVPSFPNICSVKMNINLFPKLHISRLRKQALNLKVW